jgi:hypothetical protein
VEVLEHTLEFWVAAVAMVAVAVVLLTVLLAALEITVV